MTKQEPSSKSRSKLIAEATEMIMSLSGAELSLLFRAWEIGKNNRELTPRECIARAEREKGV